VGEAVKVGEGLAVPSARMVSTRGRQLLSSAEIRWPITSRGVQPPAVSGVSTQPSGRPVSSARATAGVRSSTAVVSARKAGISMGAILRRRPESLLGISTRA
jgi:hypothetical protein